VDVINCEDEPMDVAAIFPMDDELKEIWGILGAGEHFVTSPFSIPQTSNVHCKYDL